MRSEHTQTHLDIPASAGLESVYATNRINGTLIIQTEFQRILRMADGVRVFDSVILSLTRIQAEAFMAGLTKIIEKIDTDDVIEDGTYLDVESGEFI